jgi:hypothetical protein
MDYKKKYIKYKLKYLKIQYGGEPYFFAKTLRGKTIKIPIDKVETILDVKNYIETNIGGEYLAANLIITYLGQTLEDTFTFREDGLFYDRKNTFKRIGKQNSETSDEFLYTIGSESTFGLFVKY